MYDIIWFDDEHEKLELIKEEALLQDIRLIGYSNANEGLTELLNNHKRYQGVLLDGLFFTDENERGDAISQEAFGQVAKTITELKAKGHIIPWFVFSGQKSFVKDENTLISVFGDKSFANGKIFDKSKDEDFIELCDIIKSEADKLPNTNARHNNPEIFDIFQRGYLPGQIEDSVLELLIQPLPKSNNELKAILTNIRSIHESCLIKLESIRVIPNAKASLNTILKHLSGNCSRDNDWKPTTTVYQTTEIENLHKWIYFTCGTYIHYLNQQHYEGYMISNYTVESLRSGLMEILLWFKETYRDNI